MRFKEIVDFVYSKIKPVIRDINYCGFSTLESLLILIIYYLYSINKNLKGNNDED